MEKITGQDFIKKEKNIQEIKNELQAACESELPVFVERYETDKRSGVQKLVAKAKKAIDAFDKEKLRTEAMKKYEKQYASYEYICGIDEVGRGPLAGPVVAGAVILPKDCQILYLNDSKQLSERKREELYDIIMREAVAVGIGMVSHERIDEINILQATYEQAERETRSFVVRCGHNTRCADQTGSDYQGRCKECVDCRGEHCRKGDKRPSDGGV